MGPAERPALFYWRRAPESAEQVQDFQRVASIRVDQRSRLGLEVSRAWPEAISHVARHPDIEKVVARQVVEDGTRRRAGHGERPRDPGRVEPAVAPFDEEDEDPEILQRRHMSLGKSNEFR